MSLHHFVWNGKERSVSVNKISGKITLRFIDGEIIEHGLEKISFSKEQSIESFVNNYSDEKRKVVSDIMLAIKERVDLISLLEH